MENMLEINANATHRGISELEGDSVDIRFGRRLAALLTLRGTDRQELGPNLDISIMRLRELENGTASALLVELSALAKFLEISLSQLLHNV
jgi:transcriptional regulator with XRE-family HTH domain